MKRASVCAILLLASAALFAQNDIPKASKASIAYRANRETLTKPSFGLAKVEALIKKYKLRDKDEAPLPAAEYKKLTIKEKFTYQCLSFRFIVNMLI